MAASGRVAHGSHFAYIPSAPPSPPWAKRVLAFITTLEWMALTPMTRWTWAGNNNDMLQTEKWKGWKGLLVLLFFSTSETDWPMASLIAKRYPKRVWFLSQPAPISCKQPEADHAEHHQRRHRLGGLRPSVQGSNRGSFWPPVAIGQPPARRDALERPTTIGGPPPPPTPPPSSPSRVCAEFCFGAFGAKRI